MMDIKSIKRLFADIVREYTTVAQDAVGGPCGFISDPITRAYNNVERDAIPLRVARWKKRLEKALGEK